MAKRMLLSHIGQSVRDSRGPISLRVLKVLEVGAAGDALGRLAGEFTQRLGAHSYLRQIVLRYANRRPVRADKEPFSAIAAVSSDSEPNVANDFAFDAHALPIRTRALHMVLAIGPKGYGFWRDWTTRRFLAEMSRVLTTGGELIVLGRLVNPWFNPELGSKRGKRYVRVIAGQLGLRVANLSTPLGQFPIASVFRIPGNQYVVRSSTGKKLGVPCYFHRFVKRVQRDNPW